VELLAIGLDILDPGLDGLEAGKLVNDQAIGVGRLADVDPELLAVARAMRLPPWRSTALMILGTISRWWVSVSSTVV
jgi:hypothetical protein